MLAGAGLCGQESHYPGVARRHTDIAERSGVCGQTATFQRGSVVGASSNPGQDWTERWVNKLNIYQGTPHMIGYW